MRKLLILTFALFISISSFAQEKIDIGVNFNFAYPTSDFGSGDKDSPIYLPPGMGMGGSVEGNYWFQENFSAGLEAGYLMFMDEPTLIDGSPINTKATAIPILVKATVFLGRGVVKPYFELGAGYCIYNQTQSVTEIFIDPILTEYKWDQSGVLISPRIGMKIDFTDQISMKINVQYNQMINEIDGEHSVDVTANGETTTTTENFYANNVAFLGVNAGVTFTLFDHFGRF